MAQLRDKILLRKIAIVIKELRENEGLTQEAVYNDIYIHIGRIETAKTNLSISTLSTICKHFKISLSDFFKKVESL
ncbi:helix-turn-helix transcriptional regulator [Agriterribacter sp.]|uniref:helix-turn-helix domain-containing protein n=1 Tax=Agriterribacter sp. TaxID=2821509 RepID=UPI002C0B6C1E|nr:helix-turn-helix transcriptional regulator [Agriterribacter sp.]HRO45539.1 helix-turn-helix transcriptional regulator [Agriterribacter sp.]HRQ17939.1 helix-turn-helix transcriptional regulator [Agriterribacter sp.]